jgi:hypothetical protein
MRVFLIVLGISLVGSVVLYNFGIAQRIWPAHPALATTLIVGGCAAVMQTLLSRDAAVRKVRALLVCRAHRTKYGVSARVGPEHCL